MDLASKDLLTTALTNFQYCPSFTKGSMPVEDNKLRSRKTVSTLTPNFSAISEVRKFGCCSRNSFSIRRNRSMRLDQETSLDINSYSFLDYAAHCYKRRKGKIIQL